MNASCAVFTIHAGQRALQARMQADSSSQDFNDPGQDAVGKGEGEGQAAQGRRQSHEDDEEV